MSDESNIEDEGIPFAEQAQKRQKRTSDGTIKLYGDLRFLLPTFNLSQHLLFHAGYAPSDSRKRINPSNFEAQMFFFSSNNMCDGRDVI